MTSVSVLKRYNLVETLEDKTTRCLMFTQAIIYWLGVIGLIIPVGIFLFDVEVNHQCSAPNSMKNLSNFSEYDNVSYRFRVVLILFFTILLAEGVRYFLFLLGLIFRSKFLMLTWLLFIPVDFLNFASMIILHTWRFRLSGQLCSCVNSEPLCRQDTVTPAQR